VNSEQQSNILQGRAAQYPASDPAYEVEEPEPQPTTVGDMKRAILEDEGGSPTDLKRGIEIRDDSPKPAPMEAVDPEWSDFQERQEMAQTSESAAWEVAADATEKSALHNAMRVLESYEDEAEVAGAAIHLASVSMPGYAAFLDHLAEEYDPSFRDEIAESVINTLGLISDISREREFQSNWAEAQALNTAGAMWALDNLIRERDMSPEDVQRLDRHWTEANGEPLRTSLERTLDWDRPALLEEAAIKSEASERGERLQRFAASFFSTPSTSVSEGLQIAGGVPRDLPAIMFDSGYAAYRAEKSIRAEDEARASQARPQRDSADDIKYQLLAGTEDKDWRQGLSDDKGRPTSYDEIAANDPMSLRSQQARQREIEMRKIANATGAKRR
jgi:hypothetical protein